MKDTLITEVSFMGWENCLQLQSGDLRLIITTAIGPRIIGGFLGDRPNIFHVDPETAGQCGDKEWHLYGGHRLWHAPEARPRTYEVDNSPVNWHWEDNILQLDGTTDPTSGIRKTLLIEPLGEASVRVTHLLRNDNLWEIELAAWALSVMAPGGCAVAPLPQGDKNALLPNRYFTVWPYANMADKRLEWAEKYLLLRQSSDAVSPFKIGFNAEDGWLAYLNNGTAFIKRFTHIADAEYPDNGCSVELYTNKAMLEVESLSPLYDLGPGESISHTELWQVKAVAEESVINDNFINQFLSC